MSFDPYARKQKWEFRGKGPGGRNLCFCGCGQEVQPPRRSAATEKCVTDWHARNDPSTIAGILLARDRGICALCGRDTEALRKRVTGNVWVWGINREDVAFWIADQLGHRDPYQERRKWRYDLKPDVEAALEIHEFMWRREIEIPWMAYREEQQRELAALGFTDPSRRWWEADHIIPVVEGGGGCGPDGYRTLCLPCHRRETAALAARRAAARRVAKQPEFTL